MLLKTFLLLLLFVFVQSQEDTGTTNCADTCHTNAECVQFLDGNNCCNCTSGFIGDGVNCYFDNLFAAIRGKIRGKINDIVLEDFSYVGNIQYAKTDSKTQLSIQQSELAEALPLLINLFTPVFWMFGGTDTKLSKPALNGFELTGGTFTHISNVRFLNNEQEDVGHLYIQQHFSLENDDQFIINANIEINGQLPKVRKDEYIAYPDFQQAFYIRSNKDYKNHLIETGGAIRYSKFSTQSESTPQQFTIEYNDRINFTTCATLNSLEGASDVIVKFKELSSYYISSEQYVRFFTKQLTYPIDESSDECDTQECNIFAYCSIGIKDGSMQPFCTCKDGYDADGSECFDRNECEENTCHPDATCTNLHGHYLCKCNPPYVGDGQQDCYLEEPENDVCSTCHVNAECVTGDNSQKMCKCLSGYQGDGVICQLIPEEPERTEIESDYECGECDINAECVRHENKAGLCCVCNENYIGNGKYCFFQASPIVVSGKINGVLNGEKLSDLELQCSVLTLDSDSRNHMAISSIPHRLSASFQTLMLLLTTVNWLFAGPQKSGIVSSNEQHRIAVNGFTLTGGNFTRTVRIMFNDVTLRQDDGNEEPRSYQVVVKQTYKGLIKDGLHSLKVEVDTQIDGELPLLDPKIEVHFQNFKQIYKHIRRGLIESEGILNYETVTSDISEGSFTNQLFYTDRIEYNECTYERDYSDEMRVNSKRASVLHIDNIVRFSSSNFIYPNEAEDDPCESNSCSVYAECTPDEYDKDKYKCECKPGFAGDGFKCIDVNECDFDESPCDENAVCYNLLGHYDCKCKAPYQGSGKECVYEGSCSMCSTNAYCEETEDFGKKCICNTGYTGNGFQCVKIESPDTICSSCSTHAECLINKQTKIYECSCKDGFLGDGTNCEPLPCNEHYNCGTHATCDMTSSGRYECRCSNGYFGDGYQCSSQSCEILSNCGENARCLIDPVTQMHHCVCIPGYVGNGYKCVVDSQPCNIFNNCHQHAECILDEHLGHHKCSCKPGYYGDGHKCTAQNSCVNDPHVCDVNALCVFESKVGEHICKCRYGYEGDGLHRRCYPIGEGPVGLSLVYAQGVSLHKLSLDKNEQDNIQPYKNRIVYIPHQTAVAVDFDCHEQDVYWSDVSGKVINKVKADGSKYEIVLQDLQSPEGIAVDWISRNIFITDSKARTIELANLKGNYRKVIVKTNLHNPRGIAVDPIDGYIFWTDWYRKSPKIERANMDGTHRVILVNDNIGIPNGLYYDQRRKEVCWADAKTKRIECVGRDGTGRRNITQISLMHPFDIAEVGQNIYWSDWSRKEIPTVTKSGHSGESLKLAIGGHGRVYGLSVVKHSCPIGTNECTFNNGDCEYLCVPLTNNDRQCICPDNVSPSQCMKPHKKH